MDRHHRAEASTSLSNCSCRSRVMEKEVPRIRIDICKQRYPRRSFHRMESLLARCRRIRIYQSSRLIHLRIPVESKHSCSFKCPSRNQLGSHTRRTGICRLSCPIVHHQGIHHLGRRHICKGRCQRIQSLRRYLGQHICIRRWSRPRQLAVSRIHRRIEERICIIQ